MSCCRWTSSESPAFQGKAGSARALALRRPRPLRKEQTGLPRRRAQAALLSCRVSCFGQVSSLSGAKTRAPWGPYPAPHHRRPGTQAESGTLSPAVRRHTGCKAAFTIHAPTPAASRREERRLRGGGACPRCPARCGRVGLAQPRHRHPDLWRSVGFPSNHTPPSGAELPSLSLSLSLRLMCF